MTEHREITESPLRLIDNLETQIALLQGEVERLRLKCATMEMQLQSAREEEHF